MLTLEEIKNLYANNLKDELLSMEIQRKSIVKKLLFRISGFLTGIVLVAVGAENTDAFLFIGISLILAFIVSFFWVHKNYLAYRHDFKTKVVEKVIKLIDPSWNYDYKASISETEYRGSELFQKRYDRYSGDDLIWGAIEKTDFRLSELHTEYKTVTTDSKGRRREQWHTIFKGIFAHADFNKHIQGKTFVLPDYAERIFGKWGQSLQKLNPRGQLVKLENPEFEKLFVVYSSDQNEARYILSPVMMEAMVNLQKKYNKTMYFSFIDTRVYMAITFNNDLFEPRLFKSGVRFKDIIEMFGQLNLIAVIVHEMNLNTRIWTKA